MFLLAKTLYIAAVGLWFAGLFLLPQLMAAHARHEPDADDAWFVPIGRRLYFHVMTPAALVAVLLGGGLIVATQWGAWLPAKLVLVGIALGLHVYLGLALFDMSNGRSRHGPRLFVSLGWFPLLLVAGIVVLSSLKPLAIAPLDPATVVPAEAVPAEPGGTDGA